MKKGLLFGILLLSLVLSLSILSVESQEVTDSAVNDSATNLNDKVNLAYKCLNDKVKNRCTLLSLDEKIFALMAIGKCQDELLAESTSQECWPGRGCTITSTAQAVLALERTTYPTTEARDWLLTKTAAPGDIDWYLQIDIPSSEESVCTITYDGTPQTTTITDEGKFIKSAGNCLSPASGDYWLRVSPSCYGKEFQISCKKGFQTSLLYKKKTSSIFYVAESVQGASGDGTTSEQVSSSCFVQGGSCTYEGTLWATLVLDSNNQDIKPYLPYLTTLADENQQYTPDAFLYLMTGNAEYKNNLLLRQRENQFWDEGNSNRFYDTAVALYGLSGEVTDSEQKASAKQWLMKVQDTGDNPGCWKGSVANTGFLLSVVWPEPISASTGSCRGVGYHCISEITCKGNVLPGYFCAPPLKCCDTLPVMEPCDVQGGEICTSNQRCSGSITQASPLDIGETCCIGGSCDADVADVVSACEQNLGTCEYFDCSDDQEEISYSCAGGSKDDRDICCIAKTQKKGGSLGWIILLVFLILAAILGIIFRKKLRPFFDKMVSKFKKKGGPMGRPGGRPGMGMPGRPPMTRPGGLRRPVQRTVLPPNAAAKRPPQQRPPARPKAMDDVLSRLKEMSK